MSAELGKGQRSYLQIGSLGHVLKAKGNFKGLPSGSGERQDNLTAYLMLNRPEHHLFRGQTLGSFLTSLDTDLLSSMSMAPPPATTCVFFLALLTIMMASWRDLSASSMKASLPPLSTIVAVLALGQPVKRLYLSAPTCVCKALKFLHR